MPKLFGDQSIANQLLGVLAQCRVTNEEGKEVFEAFAFTNILSTLSSFASFPDNLSDLSGREILSRAIVAVPNNTDLNVENVSKHFYLELAARNRMPPECYLLRIALSIAIKDYLPKRFRVGDAIVFTKGHSLISKLSPEDLPPQAHLLYQQQKEIDNVVVKVEGDDQNDSFINAIDTIDVVRAILNLCINRKKAMRIPLGSHTPVNDCRLGPLFILYNREGKTIQYWTDRRLQGSPIQRIDPPIDPQGNVIIGMLRRLYHHGCFQYLRRGLLLYVRALDSPDWDNAFLECWRALEHLTLCSNVNGGDVIERCMLTLPVDPIQKLELEHLRRVRNRLVHQAVDPPGSQTVLFQIKRYVELMLVFIMKNPDRFKSEKCIATYMTMKHEKTALQSQIEGFSQGLSMARWRMKLLES
ncbi:MAG: hypothetical protein U1E45_23425 [Geminicoccaceae bacterium]